MDEIVGHSHAGLELRIGVAGHRHLGEGLLPILRQRLKRIYADLYGLFEKAALAENATWNVPAVIFVSSLAEGADRLCVESGLIPFPHELAAVLPFGREEYERDFAPGSSVVDSARGTVDEFRRCLARVKTGFVLELDGNPGRRNEAYVESSVELVRHSDVLVAVFDGDLSVVLGTAATVLAALKRNVPVIHVSINSPCPVVLFPSGSAAEQGRPVAYTEEQLERELRRVVRRAGTQRCGRAMR